MATSAQTADAERAGEGGGIRDAGSLEATAAQSEVAARKEEKRLKATRGSGY